MKATFSVGDGSGSFVSPLYEIGVCFNGEPGKVVLEVDQIVFNGYSGASGDPVTTQKKQSESVMRTVLKHSEARAIASALLSAATEARTR
jgi:hypothetical protein